MVGGDHSHRGVCLGILSADETPCWISEQYWHRNWDYYALLQSFYLTLCLRIVRDMAKLGVVALPSFMIMIIRN